MQQQIHGDQQEIANMIGWVFVGIWIFMAIFGAIAAYFTTVMHNLFRSIRDTANNELPTADAKATA